MEISHHTRLSQKRWGGKPEDYLEIHRLIDSTKVLCSDNRHRIFHTHWAVKEVVVPIFGETFINQAGNSVDVKALCEKDHLLVDYNHRFIPTLADFVNAMDDIPMAGLAKRLETFHVEFVKNSEFSTFLLSPLAVTGKLKSLLITHKSWFMNHILPKLGNAQPLWVDFDITPALFFDAMRFELWMDNGFEVPNSAVHLANLQAFHSAKSHSLF
jgi:hypothetical protein